MDPILRSYLFWIEVLLAAVVLLNLVLVVAIIYLVSFLSNATILAH